MAGCIVGTIVRDTRGASLRHAERFNFFPASPLCSIVWTLVGECRLIGDERELERPWTGAPLPALAVVGGFADPLISWNPGETLAVSMSFYPDAFADLTGVAPGALAGRALAAKRVVPQRLLGPCDRLTTGAATGSLDAGLAALEGEIAALDRATAPTGRRPVRSIDQWGRELVADTKSQAPGHSARQSARRIKARAGVNKRDLQGFGRSEALFAALHNAAQAGGVDWADLAADCGFADQPHMIRLMRRHTGFTPEQFRRGAAASESFWGYRLLREFFGDPRAPGPVLGARADAEGHPKPIANVARQ